MLQMFTVAEQLRQAREAQNLTVYQVADVTKIRTDHIRALDEGNYDVFCAPVYIRGFVRSYASLLRLEVPVILQQLNEELALSDKHREPPPLTRTRRTILDVLMYQLSKLNWRIFLPILGVIILAVAGWFVYRAMSHPRTKAVPSRLGPGLYQPAKKAPGHTLPLPAPTRR
jgi:cytoskeletal protein RodZ